MADIASEFELDGECIISTDEDEGNPPWKTTFEHGELVEWHGNVFYTKVNTKLFYWSVYPMHGLVWAESVEDAQNMVMDKLREKFPDEDEGSMDDVAIYPVNQPIDTEFQMFDH